MTGAGQLPVPLQAAAAVCVPPLQLAARQEVDAPGRAQALTLDPSQAPPQLEPSLAQAGRPPLGAPETATQVPALPATLQAWHCPPQAELQQTPSAQAPLPH